MSHSTHTDPAGAPPVPQSTRTSALDGALVHGIAWSGAMKWTSQILSWVSTLLVGRMLTPDDYGLVGMALIYLGLITLLSEFGIGTTVVTLRDLTAEQVAQINGLSLIFGVAAFAVSCAVSLPLGWFFDEPQLPPVIIALSVAFVITAFRTVPYSLLQRELRFKVLAITDGGQALLGAVSTIVFALLGLRYWSLVLGPLVSAVASTVVVVASRRHRLAWPRVQSLRYAIGFSWNVLVSRFAWYVYTTADYFVAGKVLGRSALGAYGFASTLANLPTDKVTALVLGVTPSIFSAVQKEPAALRRYLLSITEGLALITLPATLGLALIAHDFVLSVLGEKWRATIAPLQLLAAYAAFRSLTPLLPQVLFVTGDGRFVMRNSLVAAVVLPVAFYLGSRWGSIGIAAAWMVAHPFVAAPLYWRVFRTLDLSGAEYLRALWPALAGVCVMGVVIWALGHVLPREWPLLLQVVVQIIAGGVAYLTAVLSLRRERLRTLYHTWKLASS